MRESGSTSHNFFKQLADYNMVNELVMGNKLALEAALINIAATHQYDIDGRLKDEMQELL
jgi:hypothetical protein